MFPALRDELFGIGAKVIRTAVHDPGGVIHNLSLADQDGRRAVGAAADRKDGVGYGFAAIEWDHDV